MRKCLCFLLGLMLSFSVSAGNGKWMSVADRAVDSEGTWTAFRKDVRVSFEPGASQRVELRIAADTKYWLWINGQMAVFEGGLKRGPKPGAGYYDVVDVTEYLHMGLNQVALLLWHFGKDGFSHLDSGKSGVIIESDFDAMDSGKSWMASIHPAYAVTGWPLPNYRLAESNILFDARKDIPGWETATMSMLRLWNFRNAVELGKWGDQPWGELTERPIPQWKNSGIRTVEFQERAFDLGEDQAGVEKGPFKTTPVRIQRPDSRTYVADLPSNIQITPVLTLYSEFGGDTVKINTDHVTGGGVYDIRAEYVTRPGVQTYESLGWMNGEHIVLDVPSKVTVKGMAYRETGYDTEAQGRFQCDNAFFNRFWEKGLRTLYVNMRDTYYDCPDRERAQWWGDAVILMGESFYTYSTSVHQLMRKGILELCNHQNEEGILHAPIPGNYTSELPSQMLAAVGRFGFWNYYMNTGDLETIRKAYPAVKRYLSTWKFGEDGLVIPHQNGWLWGDWGNQKDIKLILGGWLYMAYDAASRMSEVLGCPQDAPYYRSQMKIIQNGFDGCWNGYAYRNPAYQGETDDRVQALAVIAGIADKDKYPQIKELFKTQLHASPYMEKYVMDALFIMGEGTMALSRAEKRFNEMVNNPDYSTLYEGWGIGSAGYGGGTTNHAWSAGVLTVISQRLFGVYPLEAGWKKFEIRPQMALFESASLSIPTIQGTVSVSFEVRDGKGTLKIGVPQSTVAVVTLPGKAETREFTAGEYTLSF